VWKAQDAALFKVLNNFHEKVGKGGVENGREFMG